MEIYEVMIGKFENSKDFGKISHLFIDEKTVFDILAVKDEKRKCAIDINTLEEYRYFDRDDKNRILSHEKGIEPEVFYALRFEEADLSKAGTLQKLSLALKARKVEQKKLNNLKGDVMKTGLNKARIREISKLKSEPKWMLDFRLKSYEKFMELSNPIFGPDLKLNFDDITYYRRATENSYNDWNKVPENIKDTFSNIGLINAEKKYLGGVGAQYESEVVYHNMLEEIEKNNIIFCDTDTALKKYPDIFKKYFNNLVKYDENKYTALNGAVWSGGTFIYIPPHTKIDRPLQSYFRINSKQMGQFERTIIIVDEGSEVHYMEGCTAPTYTLDSLHAAVVEIYVMKDAKCRYTTIQNWSKDIYNLVTKRAIVEENGLMEWIDGNIGSKINMKYPCCILNGEFASGNCISIAVAKEEQIQDTGAKMIHLAPHTTSNIISKSISFKGGNASYRGTVNISSNANYSKSTIKCDTIIMDDESKSDTIPKNKVGNTTSTLEHEATVSKIDEEKLFYLMSRGLTIDKAKELLIMGFIDRFRDELPMEYAVELNALLKNYF